MLLIRKPMPTAVFDYVYFNVYHYYSRQAIVPNSVAVRLKSMYLLSISAGGWILFLQSIVLRFIRHGWFASQGVAMFNALSIYTIITVLFYRIFIVEERDQKIFDKYINQWENNPNKKRDLIITSFVAAAPYLSMICMKVIYRSING